MVPDYEHGAIKLFNMDCMQYMRSVPDKYFDLAIVDPPYGLGKKLTSGGGQHLKFKNHKEIQNWDIRPEKEYFSELERISKNRIIWGGNYFDLPPCRGFLIWDKQQSVPNFSACEFAWNSIDCVSKLFSYRQSGFSGETKIHPTQKPVKLYEWILDLFSDREHKIFDSHLGSGSNAIASHYFGVNEFVGCETDKNYFDSSIERIKRETSQISLL